MDIFKVNEDLVRTLAKLNRISVLSKEFAEIKENYSKVIFVEELLTKYEQFPKLDLKITLHNNKNNDKSLKFRQEGNEYFSLRNKDYHKALKLYNQSICFAENDSENLSIGYANRSAILYEWKRYKECLNNIELAKKANYPKKLHHKLDEREKNCLKYLKSQTEGNEDCYDFKLSYGNHPKVPFIAECLEMGKSEEFGRYIYTKQDLNPGDLVCIEEPYCSILLPALKYSRCANCKVENYLTLIPCPNCTSVMFCSESCLKEATNSFHKFECPIIDMLFELFNKIHLIALRVTLTTLNIFSNIDECIGFCTNENNLNQNSFTLNYSNFSKREHYHAIHGLVTNQDKRLVADLFQRSVITAVLKKYLLEYTVLKDLLNDDCKVKFFVELLFHHLQTSSSNMHSVDVIESKRLADEQCFASAAYAFGSLMNHSCAPNIVRIYNGTTVMIFILRPIQVNGILYDNYGYHYAIQSKHIRQHSLETQYKFMCNCEACENNYPLHDQLPCPSEVPEEIKIEDIEKLMAYDRNFAKNNLKRYCEFLKEYSKFFPCSQITSVEESLKMALNILIDAIPIKLKH